MLIISDRTQIEHDYVEYFSDESRLSGQPVNTIYFPETDTDVQMAVTETSARNETLTISGGRTGIVGGAVVCESTVLVSLEKLQNPLRIGWDAKGKKYFVRVSAGHLLSTVQDYLACGAYTFIDDATRSESEPKLWFPINPTETTAEIGGAVATNASGSRSYRFGAMREWVRSLRVVLADGTLIDIGRGMRSTNGVFHLANTFVIPALTIARPDIKQTLGFCLPPDGDLIDLFIGSEGTLGIITEVDLFVREEPRNVLGQMIVFKGKESLLQALTTIKTNKELQTIAIEYYGPNALAFLREHALCKTDFIAMSDSASCALYVETFYDSEDELDTVFAFYEKLLVDCEISDENTWAAFDAKNLSAMSKLRHVLPEMINQIISERKKDEPLLRKLSTDMAVPETVLAETLMLYEKTLQEAGLEYVIFGHIGDGNVHINILPRQKSDLEMVEKIYEVYADHVIHHQGAIAAEHGIGRVKKNLLKKQFSHDELDQMKSIKKNLDPNGILNPGVLFD